MTLSSISIQLPLADGYNYMQLCFFVCLLLKVSLYLLLVNFYTHYQSLIQRVSSSSSRRDRQTDSQSVRNTEKERKIDSQKQRQRQTNRKTNTGKQRGRQTDIQTDKDRERFGLKNELKRITAVTFTDCLSFLQLPHPFPSLQKEITTKKNQQLSAKQKHGI